MLDLSRKTFLDINFYTIFANRELKILKVGHVKRSTKSDDGSRKFSKWGQSYNIKSYIKLYKLVSV